MDPAGDNDITNLPSDGDNPAHGNCNCSCSSENIKLRVEVSVLRKLLQDRWDDDKSQPVAKKPRLDPRESSQSSEDVLSEDSCDIGDYSTKGNTSEESACPDPDKVFTDVVLRNIGSYLSLKDLLECRLVCRAWKNSASSVLRRRPVHLTERIYDIPALISWVKEDAEFPFLGYQWASCRPQEEETWRPFLSEFSHIFRRLRLSYSFFNINFVTQFTKALATYFSHVEVLDMKDLECNATKSITPEELVLISSCLEKLQLPKLEVLTLPSPVLTDADNGVPEFFRDLIKAAPRLRRIVGFTPSLTPGVTSSAKMNAVSVMHMGSPMITSPLIGVTLNPPCRLSELVIDDPRFWRRDADVKHFAFSAFVSILNASSETLESLTMVDLGSQLRDLPVFSKLKRLCLKGNLNLYPETYRLFREDVSDLFPVLNTVIVEFDSSRASVRSNKTQEEILRLFLWDEPLLSVTSLEIRFAMDEDGIDFFGRIFPSVIQLWIDWEECYHISSGKYREANLWDIWTVPFNLQRLEIHGFNPWAMEDFSLDSFITGIHESVCRNLRRADYAKLMKDSSYCDALRGYPSILNFKKSLSKLIISVGNSRGRWSETVMSKYVEYRDAIASPVSAFYGTKLMTNKLQLYVAYDHRSCYAWRYKKFLASIKDYATIIHQDLPDPNYYDPC